MWSANNMEIYCTKIGFFDCKWSNLNATGTHTPCCHSILGSTVGCPFSLMQEKGNAACGLLIALKFTLQKLISLTANGPIWMPQGHTPYIFIHFLGPLREVYEVLNGASVSNLSVWIICTHPTKEGGRPRRENAFVTHVGRRKIFSMEKCSLSLSSSSERPGRSWTGALCKTIRALSSVAKLEDRQSGRGAMPTTNICRRQVLWSVNTWDIRLQNWAHNRLPRDIWTCRRRSSKDRLFRYCI